MDLKQLEYFLLVSDQGGFSAAALRSGVGQPAISRQIKLLEEEVGAALFIRNGRGAALTSAGRSLVGHARAVVERIRIAKADLAELSGTIAGTIVLGLPASVGSTLTTPLLKRFMSEYPLVTLTVVEGLSGHLHEWLLRGNVDLAAVYLPTISNELFSEVLTIDDIYLIGPGSADMPHDTIDFEDVLSLPLILTSLAHSVRKKVDILAAKAETKLNVRCEVDSIVAIKELAAEGFGYALLPLSLVRQELADGRVRGARIVKPELTRELLLAMSPRSQNTPLIRAVRRELRSISEQLI